MIWEVVLVKKYQNKITSKCYVLVLCVRLNIILYGMLHGLKYISLLILVTERSKRRGYAFRFSLACFLTLKHISKCNFLTCILCSQPTNATFFSSSLGKEGLRKMSCISLLLNFKAVLVVVQE